MSSEGRGLPRSGEKEDYRYDPFPSIPPFPLPPPSFPSPPLPSPLLPCPPLPLEVGPLAARERCKLPQRSYLWHILRLGNASGRNNFNDFLDNQQTKFRAVQSEHTGMAVGQKEVAV